MEPWTCTRGVDACAEWRPPCVEASQVECARASAVIQLDVAMLGVRAVSLALILPHGLPIGVRQVREPCDAFLVCRVCCQCRVVAVRRHNLCRFWLQRQRRPLSLALSNAVLATSVCYKNETITLLQVLRGDFCSLATVPRTTVIVLGSSLADLINGDARYEHHIVLYRGPTGEC